MLTTRIATGNRIFKFPLIRSLSKDAAPVLTNVAHRVAPPCYNFPDRKPCFDISKLIIERGRKENLPMVKQFIFSQYFAREPSIIGLYIPPNSCYLHNLCYHLCRGDRWEAFEIEPRTKEKRLVGMLVASKKYPWEAAVLERQARSYCEPFSTHLFFRAHCLRSPNLFYKYKIPFIYNVDLLATASDVCGQGVASVLLRAAVLYSIEIKYPLIQLIATNTRVSNMVKRAGMVPEWSMKYQDYVDYMGRQVFFPRNPHTDVKIYIRLNNTAECPVPDKELSPELYKTFKDYTIDKINSKKCDK